MTQLEKAARLLEAEVNKLREVNKELLEVLIEVEQHLNVTLSIGDFDTHELILKCENAIKKAQG